MSRLIRFSSTVFLLVSLAALAAAAEAIRPDEVSAPMAWGGVDNVTRLHHLYFSGQPDRAALEKAKAEGVTLVINLRTDAEMESLGFDEAAAAEELGLRYERVPVGKPPFSTEAFQRVESLVSESHPKAVWVHCASSQRAGAWLATHVAGHHQQGVEEALAIGRRAGMTSSAAEAGARALIEAGEEDPAE